MFLSPCYFEFITDIILSVNAEVAGIGSRNDYFLNSHNSKIKIKQSKNCNNSFNVVNLILLLMPKNIFVLVNIDTFQISQTLK